MITAVCYHYKMSLQDVLDLTPAQIAILVESLSELIGTRDA